MINKHIKYVLMVSQLAWDVADSPVNIMNEATMAEFFRHKQVEMMS
jgi:3-hydroxyacyl-CoA dehydrogenase/enoyl-CoA hydratase/3-hydroxybutyryl-CoA epimerase